MELSWLKVWAGRRFAETKARPSFTVLRNDDVERAIR